MPETSDRDEFDRFYRGSYARVVHLVYASTGDLGVAQDAAQEAFARAWSQWRTVRRCDDPSAWVRTVARRVAISDWRKSSNRRRAEERLGAPAALPAPSPDRLVVLEALRRLARETRETLALFYLADLSIEQIAAETDTPTGTVKARLSRGRTQLATLLREPATLTESEVPHA